MAKTSNQQEISGFQKIMNRLETNKDKFLPENAQTIKKILRDARPGKTIKEKEKKLQRPKGWDVNPLSAYGAII